MHDRSVDGTRVLLASAIATWAVTTHAFAQDGSSQSDVLPIVLFGGGILVAAIFLASFGRNARDAGRGRKSGDDGTSAIIPATAGSDGHGKDSHHDGHDGSDGAGDGGGDGGGGGGGD